MKNGKENSQPKSRRVCLVALTVMPLLTACAGKTVMGKSDCLELPDTYSSDDNALADQLETAPRETVEAVGQLAQIRRIAKC